MNLWRLVTHPGFWYSVWDHICGWWAWICEPPSWLYPYTNDDD
jgi:hypothetical protein